jgi:hypothetical protein
LLAWGVYEGRKSTIRGFFSDGATTVSAAEPSPLVAEASASASQTRVIVLDGLGRSTALELPALSRLCARGREFRVDTGFPTVSLPVQQVLWTGLTQAQGGVYYRIKRHDSPPRASLPAQIPHSVAVAESHPDIIASFGFGSAQPPPGDALPSNWREEGFASAAKIALASDAALAFVHVLRIDEAGHASGADSAPYREAAQTADGWLDAWVALAPHARWMVLADHGHLDEGGHGGRDSEIPLVRACLFGSGIEADPRASTATIHLVDLSRELFAWTGFAPPREGLGRPLTEAAEAYRAGEHLPPIAWWRYGLAGTAALTGFLVALRLGAGSQAWWFLLSYATFLGLMGTPSLSMPTIYPPMGLTTAKYGGPGLLLLVATLAASEGPLHRVALRQLAPPLGLLGAALGLAWGQPPLVPLWTAHASIFATWCVAASTLTGLLSLAFLGAGRARGEGSPLT